MERYLYFLLTLLAFVACSKPSPEEVARQAASQSAEKSYNALLSARYEQFLSGRADADSIPEEYRQQLLASYKQFMVQQQQEHGGIRSLSVTSARIDSTQNLIQVFLLLNYADSLNEEIVVPMIERNGEWKMK